MIPMEVTDVRTHANTLKQWNRGRITMRNGKLVSVRRRQFYMPASIARVWFQARFKPGNRDQCTLDYRCNRIGGFMVVEFIQSGPSTQLATLRGACQILDEIARLRQSVAILAHVSTSAISDRLLKRWGWEPHAGTLSGRHWIKRFYSGYRSIDLDRYHAEPTTAPVKQTESAAG
jgi:hypothetical protein